MRRSKVTDYAALKKNHENLHKNVNKSMFSFTFLCKFSCICNFAIFVQIFMKFSPKCRTKNMGMINTILGSFGSFLIGKEPLYGPKSMDTLLSL